MRSKTILLNSYSMIIAATCMHIIHMCKEMSVEADGINVQHRSVIHHDCKNGFNAV